MNKTRIKMMQKNIDIRKLEEKKKKIYITLFHCIFQLNNN